LVFWGYDRGFWPFRRRDDPRRSPPPPPPPPPPTPPPPRPPRRPEATTLSAFYSIVEVFHLVDSSMNPCLSEILSHYCTVVAPPTHRRPAGVTPPPFPPSGPHPSPPPMSFGTLDFIFLGPISYSFYGVLHSPPEENDLAFSCFFFRRCPPSPE